jgi:hypothetical protein
MVNSVLISRKQFLVGSSAIFFGLYSTPSYAQENEVSYLERVARSIVRLGHYLITAPADLVGRLKTQTYLQDVRSQIIQIRDAKRAVAFATARPECKQQEISELGRLATELKVGLKSLTQRSAELRRVGWTEAGGALLALDDSLNDLSEARGRGWVGTISQFCNKSPGEKIEIRRDVDRTISMSNEIIREIDSIIAKFKVEY